MHEERFFLLFLFWGGGRISLTMRRQITDQLTAKIKLIFHIIYFPMAKFTVLESLIRLQGLHSREAILLCIEILQGFRS
jgi:hypothetical protein